MRQLTLKISTAKLEEADEELWNEDYEDEDTGEDNSSEWL